jgi:UDP-N-acetylglucosamine:LPS N-acetylglucosamine transferase
LLREIRRFDPDVVVSVFNLASQALGRLRARGRLTCPVVTYLSDPGPHPYWVHPAVDLYLVPLAETARGLTAYGARRTAVVAELVRPRFADHPIGRAEARRRLGLPLDADVVLVSGGSLATGTLQRTVGRLARAGVLPVTLCGTDAVLRRRLSRRRAGVALGWTDDVAAVMAAADVLVDNAGGVTCAEALASGLPVVLFRPLPGHGRLSAETLDVAGVAPYARTDHELISLVRVLCTRRADGGGRPVAPRSGPRGDAVDAVLELGLSAAGGPRP